MRCQLLDCLPGRRVVWRIRLATILVALMCSSGILLTWPLAPMAGGRARASSLAAVGDGDVFVSSDPREQTWTIGNSELHVRFRLTQTKDFVLDEVRSPRTGRVMASVAEFDSSAVVNGTTLSPGSAAWGLADVAVSEHGSGVRVAFTFRSPTVPVTAVRSYVCYPDSPTIETWTTFQTTGVTQATIANTTVWRVAVRATTVHYVQGLRSNDTDPTGDASFARRSVGSDAGDLVTLTEPNRSTESFLPMIAADVGLDEFFGGLLWSGSWQIDVSGLGGLSHVTAGHPRLSTVVDASHPLETPHGFFGFTGGGPSAVTEALGAFVLQGLRGGRPFEPLVTYNTWFSHGTEIDEQTIQDEMEGAARLGVELFVLDAGWYLGAGRDMDFVSGLGTWQVDSSRFPSGLAALRDYAHSLGMRFGLWVEPERVDAATIGKSGLVREAWLAKSNGSYLADDAPQVCLASAEARQWVSEQLIRLLDDVQPDYLKWDNNLWVNCNRSGHGHGTSDGNYAHVTGLYGLLAALRDRYPGMLIENCSQGGNRLDLGMLRYTDTAWMDDRTIPAAHVRHNLEGLMTFFPPAYLLSFAASGLDEVLPGASDLPLFMRSRMLGILGLTYRAADLSEADQEGIAREITLYKRIRDTVRGGSGTVLTDQAGQNGPPWDAVQEFSSAFGDGVIFAFQNDTGVPRVRLQPDGLESGAAYLITNAAGTIVSSATGAELMADGVDVTSSPESAAHVLFFEKQTAGATIRAGTPATPR